MEPTGDIWNAIFDERGLLSERYRVTLSPELSSLYELAQCNGHDSTFYIKASRDGGGYSEAVGVVAGMNIESASPIEIVNLFEYFVRRRVPLEKILAETRIEKI